MKTFDTTVLANLAKLLEFCNENPDVCSAVQPTKNENPKTPDFATFSQETLFGRPDVWTVSLAAPAASGNTDICAVPGPVPEPDAPSPQKPRRGRVVESRVETWTVPKKIPGERLGRWEVVPTRTDLSAPETKILVDTWTYENGETRDRILAIENPQGVYIHKYRDDLYKVVLTELPVTPKNKSDGSAAEKPEDGRWFSNLARARVSIEEYALCNDWRYFVTLTIDGEKLDRTDLEAFRKKLMQMIRNLRRNYDDAQIDFLLVPELHPKILKKEGRVEWHMHGLMNIPEQFLVPFENRRIYGKDKNKFPPRYIRNEILKRNPIYHWKQYDASFGNNVIQPIINRDASARYLMKYVSKEQATTAEHLESGQHLYFVSRGLKKAEKVAPGMLGDIQGRMVRDFTKHCETCLIQWYILKDNL